MPDDVLRLLPKNGGVVMVTFVGVFISDEERAHAAAATAEEARLKALNPGDPKRAEAELKAWKAAHPTPARDAGPGRRPHRAHPPCRRRRPRRPGRRLRRHRQPCRWASEGVHTYPALLAELARRGWSDQDLRKLAGENVLRAMRQAEATAARLQAAGPASEATIEALDGPAEARRGLNRPLAGS